MDINRHGWLITIFEAEVANEEPYLDPDFMTSNYQIRKVEEIIWSVIDLSFFFVFTGFFFFNVLTWARAIVVLHACIANSRP